MRKTDKLIRAQMFFSQLEVLISSYRCIYLAFSNIKRRFQIWRAVNSLFALVALEIIEYHTDMSAEIVAIHSVPYFFLFFYVRHTDIDFGIVSKIDFFANVIFRYTKLSLLLTATHWMLFESRVTATRDKCPAINDSCRNIAVITAVDVDHCAQLLAAFDCTRCFVTSTRAGEFVNLYLLQSLHTFSIEGYVNFSVNQ